MKRYFIAAIAAISAISVLTSCTNSPSNSNTIPTAENPFPFSEEGSEQPDPLSTSDEEYDPDIASDPEVTEAPTVTEAEVTEATEPASDAQEDPLGGGSFEYNNDGAVVFTGDITQVSDRSLMAAAQALFDSACRTYWRFFVDGAYSYNTTSSITNSYGWEFYRVTDESITSFADVQDDYARIFSSRYPNELSDYYKEENGAVYELNGARGGDLYYSASKIISVDSRSGDEYFFTVEHYYDGSDYDGSAPYSETETFSAVIGDDGVLRVGQFRLPY